MSKKKKEHKDNEGLTPEERESALVDVIAMGLMSPVEETAKAWAMRAKHLRRGLSKAVIQRAERRGRKLAKDHPPGFVVGMEAFDAVTDLGRHLKIPRRELDKLWGYIATHLMFQLGAREGSFYEAARYFDLINDKPRPKASNAILRMVEVTRARTPGCDCPNCRPRKAEELN
jgi:hypothetical protein